MNARDLIDDLTNAIVRNQKAKGNEEFAHASASGYIKGALSTAIEKLPNKHREMIYKELQFHIQHQKGQ